MSTRIKYGDALTITQLTKDKGMNGGKGFSYSYVEKVLRGLRKSEAIKELADKYRKAQEQLINNL